MIHQTPCSTRRRCGTSDWRTSLTKALSTGGNHTSRDNQTKSYATYYEGGNTIFIKEMKNVLGIQISDAQKPESSEYQTFVLDNLL